MTQRIESIEILKAMFSKDGINFDDNKGWNSLAEHIEVHNQLLNMELKFNVSWDDALFSWYENVYTPLKRAISNRSMRNAFPNKTTGDLYLEVSDHWFYLKEKNENISAEIAAYDFIYRNREKKNLFSKLFMAPAVNGNTSFRRPSAA